MPPTANHQPSPGACRIWTIPATAPFLDVFVAGLFARHGRDPLTLSRLTIYLPSRRAGRALREAFLRATDGAPLLLPKIGPIGGLETDEMILTGGPAAAEALTLAPAIHPLRRQLLLAHLVRRWGAMRDGSPILPAQAVALAADLAQLLDDIASEGIDIAALAGLAPAEYAEHWQITLDFLKIVTVHWPGVLAAEGAVDPATRRRHLLRVQAEIWAKTPPEDPIYAIGFADAPPDLADLLACISRLPGGGGVILPGFSLDLAPDHYEAIGADPTHPQQGMLRWLTRLGLGPDAVVPWSDSIPPHAARLSLAQEILRPAAVSHEWRRLPGLPSGALRSLARLDLANSQEEAQTIALMLREQLERPGATGMLVTPDRTLARRVAAELKRWRIDIDDSAGIGLNHTPPGIFLRLMAAAVRDDLAPVPLLALLKHPLAAAGQEPALFREEVRKVERAILRGPRPAAGFAGLYAALDGRAQPDLMPFLDRLCAILNPFMAIFNEPTTGLDAMVATHIACAEAMAATPDDPTGSRLWAREAGQALSPFLADLIIAAKGFAGIAGSDYPFLLETLLATGTVRPNFGKHPRLALYGTLEARLQRADLVILAGLNEGTWPPAIPGDPWLSRPMRRDFGLSAPEHQIGLSAHDFYLGFCASDVVLTRARRVDGTPTVPSRWLLRLDTVLEAAGYRKGLPDQEKSIRFQHYQSLLDRPDAVIPMPPPAPCPALSLRPRRLSVTEIETWMRDPYAIYARHILKLRPLDPIDADPGLAERGQFIHAALDAFIRLYPKGPLPDRAFDDLIAAGRDAFGPALARPGVWAFWWPRFYRIAQWFIAQEGARRPDLVSSFSELGGRLAIETPGGPFILTAKADRIDLLRTGGLAIIDYKTGSLPHPDHVQLGFSPQMPLEAVIAQAGGFATIEAGRPVDDLSFWKLSGGAQPGDICSAGGKETPEDLARAALAGLIDLIAVFDDPTTAYRAVPRPDYAPRYGDYRHLARLEEWGQDQE